MANGIQLTLMIGPVTAAAGARSVLTRSKACR